MLQITKSIVKGLKLTKIALAMISVYTRLFPNQIIKRYGIKYEVDLSKLIDFGIFLGGWERHTLEFLKSYLKGRQNNESK